jgi:hypothetical protein
MEMFLLSGLVGPRTKAEFNDLITMGLRGSFALFQGLFANSLER